MADLYTDYYDMISGLEIIPKITTDINTVALIIGMHGGSIEPGISQIVKSLAGNLYSMYLFEGANYDYHVTSTNWNDIDLYNMLSDKEIVISLHGCVGSNSFCYYGGLNYSLGNNIAKKLSEKGFDMQNSPVNISGISLRNPVNMGINKRGVHFEISRGLRESMFSNFNNRDNTRNSTFWHFVNGIIESINEWRIEYE
jgi:phage replication-related protein YjqB (UPF0714/DUF867 family)